MALTFRLDCFFYRAAMGMPGSSPCYFLPWVAWMRPLEAAVTVLPGSLGGVTALAFAFLWTGKRHQRGCYWLLLLHIYLRD